MGGHRDEEVAASPLLAAPTHAAGGRRRSHAADVHILSAAFLFVFSAYSAAQNLESTVNTEGDLGTVSLGILYTSFTLFSVVASPVVTRLGPKRALVVGTSGYMLFILANLVPSWYTMVPASLYLGFCASIIWVGQGTYLTSAALSHARDNNLPEGPTLGKFNGEFWGIFASTQVLGNLLSLALLRNGKDGGSVMGKNMLFVVFLGCMIVGIVLMCFLSKREEKGNNDPVHSSFGAMLKYIVAPLKDQRILLIIPLMVYIGLQNAFVWAVFTKSIVKPVLGISGVGGAMAIYGAADAIVVCIGYWMFDLQTLFGYILCVVWNCCPGCSPILVASFLQANCWSAWSSSSATHRRLMGCWCWDVEYSAKHGSWTAVRRCQGGCLCTVQGLGMRCRCCHLLLEPKHHATGTADPDDHCPLHLMWRIPVPHNCYRKAIDCQILRQVAVLISWSVTQCYQQRSGAKARYV